MTEVLTETQKELLRNDLEKFASTFFDDLLYEKVPDFHKEIYKMLPSENRLVLAAPRGFAKSTIVCVIYALWLALFGKRRDICIISASETLAVELLRKVKRELENNILLQVAFGDVQSAKWTETHIILKNGVEIRAKGAGGQIRGFRPDCLLLDDIETDESVESTEQRKKLKEWLFKACLNTLLPGGQLIIIGTVIHPLAVLNDLLETDNGWTKKKYQAYIDKIEAPGHELWAEARPHEWLQNRKKEIGSFAFASEFLNDPIADETAPIKPKHIRYYEEAPSVNVVITIDPAYSEDENADYKVAVAIGVDSRNNRYLLEYIRTHKPSGEFIDSALNLYMKYQESCLAFGVPDGGTEKQFYNTMINRVAERNLSTPITPLKNAVQTAGKVVRRKRDRIVAALQPLFEQGRYYLKEDHYDAVDELLAIGASRHDDVVDAMCYAEQLISPNAEVPEGTPRDRYGTIVDTPQRQKDYGYAY